MKRSLAWVMGWAGSIGAAVALPACGGGGAATPDGATGMHFGYAINAALVPETRADYSIDLNGDGRADNQLGIIAGALIAATFPIANYATANLVDGTLVLLIDVSTTDATEMNDDQPAVTFYEGKQMIPKVPDGGIPDGGIARAGGPDFSGSGTFAVDKSIAAAMFTGKLKNGSYKSEDPVNTQRPVKALIKLQLAGGGNDIVVPLNGAHIQFKVGADAASGAPGLVEGQIQGSIKQTDVNDKIIPAVAVLLNRNLNMFPASPGNILAEKLLDTGNCMNADGVAAVAHDYVITACELQRNPLIMSVLQPDVQIFDAAGNYAPSPGNTSPDSFSIGLGLTAVKGAFDLH